MADLRNPMTDNDFEQITLLANSIAVFEIAIKKERQGSERRCAYADILKRLRRVEGSIPGHLDGRTLDASTRFYMDLEKAIGRFTRAFNNGGLVGRDSKGRFIKL